MNAYMEEKAAGAIVQVNGVFVEQNALRATRYLNPFILHQHNLQCSYSSIASAHNTLPLNRREP